MVDAISLSIGYYVESPADVVYGSALWTLIRKLLDRGVLVVASAGNNSSRRQYFPAAFAARPRPGELPVLSVGALNPYRSRAMFSDDGGWVNAWASGAAVISTFPTDVRGSVMSDERQNLGPWTRETLNPDDFRGGFAQWNGTSFSAPALAARFLKEMAETARVNGPQGGASWLKNVSEADTRQRAMDALKAIGWKGD
jgi:subtilisin family serine protease